MKNKWDTGRTLLAVALSAALALNPLSAYALDNAEQGQSGTAGGSVLGDNQTMPIDNNASNEILDPSTGNGNAGSDSQTDPANPTGSSANGSDGLDSGGATGSNTADETMENASDLNSADSGSTTGVSDGTDKDNLGTKESEVAVATKDEQLGQDEKSKKDAKEDVAEEALEAAVGAEATKENASIVAQAHVQRKGWLNEVTQTTGRITIGTTGEALRMEAIKLKLTGTSGGVEYRAHVQKVGWEGWKSDGQQSGTTGLARRLEAMRIRLTGEAKDKYHIYYRVHVQRKGWMNWTKDGELAGTAGMALRMEAVQIMLVPNGGAAPTDGSGAAFEDRGFSASAHVQRIGWQGSSDGYSLTVGTTGQALRMEAISINRPGTDLSGDIVYRAHVQREGWQSERKNGQIAGTTGRALRVEALQIRLTGDLANKWDVWYRMHVSKVGWMAWAKNGERAGTEGMAMRVEAVQIVFVPRGGSRPSASGQATSLSFLSDSGNSLQYRSMVDGAWQSYVANGATSGTTGKAKQVRGISATVGGGNGGVSYEAHVSSLGWLPAGSNGGTVGNGTNMVQAIKFRLTGEIAKFYDVWYRAHVQSGGWLDWTRNGGSAGSTGLGIRMEAYQVKLVSKAKEAPGRTAEPMFNSMYARGKVGWQNPSGYPQVSCHTVKLPSYATGYHTYVTPSRIAINATREQCVEAFIARAYEYLNAGTPFREPWAREPGVGIDCSGLVLQCLYATGMDLEHARGTSVVGGYNPYNHYHVPAQTYNSMRWYENDTFMPVSLSSIRRGDLIFYSGHVAIYLGNGQIIHSTDYQDRGVSTANLYIWNPIGAQRPFV